MSPSFLPSSLLSHYVCARAPLWHVISSTGLTADGTPTHPDQSVAVRILIRLKYAADGRGNLARHLSTEVNRKGRTWQRECNRTGLKYYKGIEFWASFPVLMPGNMMLQKLPLTQLHFLPLDSARPEGVLHQQRHLHRRHLSAASLVVRGLPHPRPGW